MNSKENILATSSKNLRMSDPNYKPSTQPSRDDTTPAHVRDDKDLTDLKKRLRNRPQKPTS
jgi:hypothetical protein